MAISGGVAGKLGDRFEVRWTVRCLIEIMLSHADSIRLEPVGKIGEGIEFWLRRGTITEYHQVKRQKSSSGRWTIADLDRENILHHFWMKLQDKNSICVFVSTHPAFQLEKLINHARRSVSFEEFRESLLSVNERPSGN